MPPTGAAPRGRAGPRGRGSAAPRPASPRRRGGCAPAGHSEPATRPCAAAASSADTCPHHSTNSGQLQPVPAKTCAHTFCLTSETAWLYRARSGPEITHMCPRTAEPGGLLVPFGLLHVGPIYPGLLYSVCGGLLTFSYDN